MNYTAFVYAFAVHEIWQHAWNRTRMYGSLTLPYSAHNILLLHIVKSNICTHSHIPFKFLHSSGLFFINSRVKHPILVPPGVPRFPSPPTYADPHNQTPFLAQSEVERVYLQPPRLLDMENMKVLREKNIEIGHLQQQVQQLEVKCTVPASNVADM